MSKEFYDKMVAQHKCTNCGKPLPEGYKLKACQKCRKHNSAYMREYNKGKCNRCHCDLPPNYEYKTCKSCRIKKSQEYYKRKESKDER
jgi:hypothetical protein